ncbi:MAG: SPFH domain-containing protein [Muribaculaceae bacterium]|nr:SPFH domain-containing protein [Alistipes senegalensis]MCM1473330.1 SPFH domain-containing protein [Muribaculaceae bacterium]
MGLIQAALVAAGSAFGDTWKEFFYCDALPADVLVVKGKKKTSTFSANKGNDNIITNGSKIAVSDGQCMIIVDQGAVVEVCAVPGEYIYDMSTEPSLFGGSLSNNIKETFKIIGKRISFGGDAAHDQRIYYFNLKELTNNKFGTQNPVPFRMTYTDIGRNFTVGVRCNGVYSYRIADPLLFYTNVCGNVSSAYTRANIDQQLKSEFLNALNPAFAKLSQSGLRYDELPAHTIELSDAMGSVLSPQWSEKRGLEVVSVAINSVTISKDDEERIKKFEDTAWNRDASNAAAMLVNAQANAMTAAASNSNGAAMGFYGMNMAQQAGGLNAQQLFQMGVQQQQQNNSANSWKCSCGTNNTGKFCANCGTPKPALQGSWKCSCGAENTGKFCHNCGKPKPSDNGTWKCSCGAENKGKFCAECGNPKPSGKEPVIACTSCGWIPKNPNNIPRFCPECGEPLK